MVIPVYNVGDCLPSVLSNCLEFIPGNFIYVIDDGCTDDSISLIEQLPVRILRHKRNLGKGAALKYGFSKAISDKLDAVITIDGDGQHDPEYIPDLIRTYEKTSADIVLGKRSADHPSLLVVHEVHQSKRLGEIDVLDERRVSHVLFSLFFLLLTFSPDVRSALIRPRITPGRRTRSSPRS